MSQDADTIRRAFEVWNESGQQLWVERFWADDAVYREGPGWPNAGVRVRSMANSLPMSSHQISPRPRQSLVIVLG
jgi:hypothetical protein